MVHTDSALPRHLRVLFPAVPDDAVPVSDVGTRLHDRALHRRLSSIPQGTTVQDQQGTLRRRRHGSLLHPARRYTGNYYYYHRNRARGTQTHTHKYK